MVERNLDALRRIGLQAGAEDKRVTLVPGGAAESRATALMAQHGVAGRDFALLHMTSRWLFKCWPAASAAALIDVLHARGLTVVLTAAPDARETALIAEILKAASVPVVDLSGQLSLRELAALAARARIFVGVDSAPMHIAAAMRTPTVAIFGPSGELEWGPWDESGTGRHRVVASDTHPCRPCGIDGCGGGKVSECLTTLSAERVLAACEELLAK
jgi:heptosyltransferase-3